jgi:hypothetical protein
MSWVITGSQKNKGVLDEFTGAAAAYSLRDLSLLRNAPVVRVRRSSDNTEADFTALQITNGSLASWVGAGNNGFVGTWYDQSGNARHATQSILANQPQLVSSGVVIANGIQIASGNHFVVNSFSESGFLFYVGLVSGGVQFKHLTNNIVVTAGTNVWALRKSGDGSIAIDSSQSATSTSLVTLKTLTNNAELFVNGTSIGTDVSYNSFSSASSLYFNAINPYVGNSKELIVYNLDQSSNRLAIESNINAHYAIY